MDRSFFKDTICKDHFGMSNLLHYPYDPKVDQDTWGVREHTDYGLIAILMIGDKGLEVKSVNNEWFNIDPIPNTFVINVGDILERMTKGLYKSTPHRVRNTVGKSRFSVPYFYDPGWTADIKDLEFPIEEKEF